MDVSIDVVIAGGGASGGDEALPRLHDAGGAIFDCPNEGFLRRI